MNNVSNNQSWNYKAIARLEHEIKGIEDEGEAEYLGNGGSLSIERRDHYYVRAMKAARELVTIARQQDSLSASEAIYAFAGMLTTLNDVIRVGASEDAARVANLIKEFCEKQKLSDPRPGWHQNIRR